MRERSPLILMETNYVNLENRTGEVISPVNLNNILIYILNREHSNNNRN